MAVEDGTVVEPEVQELVSEGITPRTRRMIIVALAVIALASIVAEVLIVLLGQTSSDALLTIAATAVGGLAGIALPGHD